MELKHKNKFQYLLLGSFILSLSVIILGVFTRLTNAGLGCPDWPGCYGKIFPDSSSSHVMQFSMIKALTEMVHRYIAGTLSVCILSITSVIFIYYRRYSKIGIALILTWLLQATLGMLTVIWKLLPSIVLGHLLGGIITATLIWYCFMQHKLSVKSRFKFIHNKSKLKLFLIIGIILIFGQIILGGEVSSNYSALVCLDFPQCGGQLVPKLSILINALNPIHDIGINYEGGLLAYESRVMLQIAHRWGAAIVGSYLIIIMSYLFYTSNNKKLKVMSGSIILATICQICLGIINIRYLLPLFIAELHSINAIFILLMTITIYIYIKNNKFYENNNF